MQYTVLILYLYTGKIFFKKRIRLHTDKLAETVFNTILVCPKLFMETV